MDISEMEDVIREYRHPEIYELEAYINERFESVESLQTEEEILDDFDEWLEQSDLYYEKIRDQNYWSSL